MTIIHSLFDYLSIGGCDRCHFGLLRWWPGYLDLELPLLAQVSSIFMDPSRPWCPHQRFALRCLLKDYICNQEGKGQQRVWGWHLAVKISSNSLRSAWTLYLESHTWLGQRHLGLSVVEGVQAAPGTVGLCEKQSWAKEGLRLTLLWRLLCAATNPENSAWGRRPCL